MMIRKLTVAAVCVAALTVSAYAAPVTYTFSGIASGSLGGTTFTDAAFTATFTGNTNSIDTSNPPFYVFRNISGTFEEGGGATVTLTANVESNASAANIDFYDAAFTNGLGFQDNSLSGYELSTSFGPVTVPPGTT